ncbi:MAG: hypothetical protein ACK5H0_10410 [Bacteroidota bacterium]|jgi:hypothetical protein
MTNDIDKQSFGEVGCVIVSGTTQSVPAGQYCAISFAANTTITTAFPATEAPLMSGTQTGITWLTGYTIYTPLQITGTSTGKITGTAIFYKAL